MRWYFEPGWNTLIADISEHVLHTRLDSNFSRPTVKLHAAVPCTEYGGGCLFSLFA